MRNQIVCGDCIAKMNRLPENIARLIIADPPYYNVLVDEEWDTAWSCEQEYLE